MQPVSRWMIAAVLFMTFPPAAAADQVTLRNGATLSGKIVEEGEHAIILDLGGNSRVEIQRGEIRSITIDREKDARDQGSRNERETAPTDEGSRPGGDPETNPARESASPGKTDGSPGELQEDPGTQDPGRGTGGVQPSEETPAQDGSSGEEDPLADPEEQPTEEVGGDSEAARAAEERFVFLRDRFEGDPEGLAFAILAENVTIARRVVPLIAAFSGSGRRRGLATLLQQHEDGEVQRAAAAALASEEDSEVVSLFLDQLEIAPGSVQVEMLRRLRRTDDAEVIHRILGSAGKLHADALVEAAIVIRVVSSRVKPAPGTPGGIADPVSTLAEFLGGSPNSQDAAACLDLLYRLRRPGLVPVFERWAGAADPACRIIAVRALGACPDPEATDVLLLRYGAETNEDALVEYASALGARRSMRALDPLLQLASSTHPRVRRTALQVLSSQLGADYGEDWEAWQAAVRHAVQRVNRRD